MYERELMLDPLWWLILDGLAERISTLYSHQSFRGRRTPNPGQVRPPNMSKVEWYGNLEKGAFD